jgi:hypothetical protein
MCAYNGKPVVAKNLILKRDGQMNPTAKCLKIRPLQASGHRTNPKAVAFQQEVLGIEPRRNSTVKWPSA